MKQPAATLNASAEDNEWREIRLNVWPGTATVRYAVFLRKHRGLDLVWQRNLCTDGVEALSEEEGLTTPHVLRTLASSLNAVADQMEGLAE